jgi:hypothetical protein
LYYFLPITVAMSIDTKGDWRPGANPATFEFTTTGVVYSIMARRLSKLYVEEIFF